MNLHTLKRVPIDENFDFLEESSDILGKRFATNLQLEASSKA